MHYSLAQSPIQLNAWVRGITRLLCKYVKKHDIIPIFVYRGYSGAATATALACCIASQSPKNRFTFHLCYIRKPGEKSHGDDYEKNIVSSTSFTGKRYVYFIVDDFAETGDTVLELIRGVMEIYRVSLSVNDVNALFTGPSGFGQEENASHYMKIFTMDDIPTVKGMEDSENFAERLKKVLTNSQTN